MKHSLLLLTVCLCSLSVESIRFKLLPNTHKCLREELKKNHLMVGEFEVSEAPGQKVDYVVSLFVGHRYSLSIQYEINGMPNVCMVVWKPK